VTPVPRLVAVPTAPGEPSLRIGSRHFDAQEWSPGATPPRWEAAWPNPEDRIDIPAVLAPATFSAVMVAAARLHDVTTAIAARPDIPTAPLSMLPGAVRQAHGRHLAALRARARREPAIQRWLATGERLIAAAEPIVLATPEDLRLLASVLHLGLWPSHVLLEGDSLTGLLGWERVAAGSPLLDIAQATLRLQGWSDEAVEVALGAYAEARPLSPEERRLLPAVAALDAAATTGRLLEQTYAVDETARPPSALRAAIDMMLRSMAALDRSLIAQSTVGKSKRTPWRRGPRPTPMRVQEGGNPRARRR
jgi:Ser/Thr protein kinase RdoA (MazF antagonist)